MQVYLGNIEIQPNQFFKYDNFNTTVPIRINFQHDPNTYYTLLIIDEDNPEPYRIHQLVINNNITIHEYQPPQPPKNSGPHHYHILILKQDSFINIKNIKRNSFDPKRFIDSYNLKIINSLMFIVEN